MRRLWWAWWHVRYRWWDLCCRIGGRGRWPWLFWQGIGGLMSVRFDAELREEKHRE